MGTSRVKRFGASMLLSLVILAGSASTAFGADPVDTTPAPSETPIVTVAPSPTDTPAVTVAPDPTQATPSETPSPTDTPAATDSAAPSAAPAVVPAAKPTDSSKVGCVVSRLPGDYCTTGSGPVAKGKSSGAAPAGTTIGSHKISGKVTLADGSPAAHLAVGVTWNIGTYSFMGADDSVYTGSDGKFSFTEEAADGYYLMFLGEDFHELNGYYSTAGTNNFSADETIATDINLSSSDATGINVRLQTGRDITGTITGGGSALGGIQVIVESGNWMTYAAGTSTAGDGSYSIDVPDDAINPYHLYFTDRSGAYLNGVYSFGNPGHFFWNELQATDLTVNGADLANVDAELGVGYFITGHVTGSDGSGLGGVSVAGYGGYFVGRTDTKADGSYSIDVPESDDSYSLYFYYNGPPSLYGMYYDPAPGNFSDYLLGLYTLVDVTDASVSGIDVQLPTGFFIKGTVTGTGNVPVAGIAVRAEPDSVGSYGATWTAADGTYSIAVPDDSYEISFTDPSGKYLNGYYALGQTGNFSYDNTFETDVPMSGADKTGIDVQLPTGLYLSGVITGVGNAPLAGIDVELSPMDACDVHVVCYLSDVTTGADGSYSAAVPSGHYRVSVSDMAGNYLDGYYLSTAPGQMTYDYQAAESVDVALTDVGDIDLTMQHGYHIQGTVTGNGGVPVQDVSIDASDPSASDEVDWTDSDGNYDLFVASGNYSIHFQDQSGTYLFGYYSASKPGHISTASSDATSVGVTADVSGIDVQLQTGFTIQGTIVEDVSGTPIDDIEVYVQSPAYEGWAFTGADGTFSVPAIAGGYSVWLWDPQGRYDSGYDDNGTLTQVSGSASIFDVTGNVTGIDVSMFGAPGAPTNVAGVGFDSSAVVSWGAAPDRGRTITSYTVQAFIPEPGAVVAQGATVAKPQTAVPPSCTTTGALSCTVHGLTDHVTYIFDVYATNSEGDGWYSDDSAPVMPRVGDTYFAVQPARIVDSHAHVGLTKKVGPFAPATFQVTGLGGVPAGATAVTGVLTVTNATGAGYLSLTPAPVTKPTTSNLNFPKGDSRSAGVTVTLGAAGTLSITYGGGAGTSVDIYFDVSGYFVLGTSGATYQAVTPNRLLDTRYSNGLAGKFVANTGRTFQVTGRTPSNAATNVPSGAIAVTGNLTITDQSAAGHLVLTPTRQDSPSTASIYVPKGDIRATGITMMLSPDGTLSATFVSTAKATTSVVFDVTGYFLPGFSGATYVPVTPNRLVDSRIKVGVSAKLSPFVAKTFQVSGRVPSDATKNVPGGAIAITGTLTVTGETGAGYVSLTPTPVNHPTTSNMNFPKGDTRAAGVTVTLGAGGKQSVVYGGGSKTSTQVVFDVSGYFLN